MYVVLACSTVRENAASSEPILEDQEFVLIRRFNVAAHFSPIVTDTSKSSTLGFSECRAFSGQWLARAVSDPWRRVVLQIDWDLMF